MKLSTHQVALLWRCANCAQRSTAQDQNTIRSLVKRGWLQRWTDRSGTFVALTREGAHTLAGLPRRPHAR